MFRIMPSKVFKIALTFVLMFVLIAGGTAMADEKQQGQQDKDKYQIKELNIRTIKLENWDSVLSGTNALLYPKGKPDSKNSLSILVTNYASYETENIEVLQKEWYKETKNKEKWLEKIEHWNMHESLPLEKIADTADGTLYVQKDDNWLNLLAYMVKNGQPMGISIVGTGKYADLNEMKKNGTYNLFKKMVDETEPISNDFKPFKLTASVSSQTGEISIQSVSKSASMFFNNNVYKITQSVSYSPSYQCAGCYTDEQFNNTLYFENGDRRQVQLDKALLADNPTDCDSSYDYRAFKSIQKKTSLTTKSVTDYWSPNVLVITNTMPVTRASDGLTTMCMCKWDFQNKPFT